MFKGLFNSEHALLLRAYPHSQNFPHWNIRMFPLSMPSKKLCIQCDKKTGR